MISVAPEELYLVGETATAVQGGFFAVGEDDLARYGEQGYLAIEDAFTADEVAAACDDVARISMDPACFQLLMYEGGNRFSTEAGTPERKIEVQRRAASYASEDERCRAIRRIWDFLSVDFAVGLGSMARHPGLVSVVERILDGPATIFQTMALLKPAAIGSEKPWHQDHAFFTLPLDAKAAGVWIALDEATVDNGCMHVLAGRHRGGPITHFMRRDWQICDDDIVGSAATAVPLRPGGCLIFDSLLPHGTPPNSSPMSRRAAQVHFSRLDVPQIPDEERLAVFGSEGTGATC